MIKSLILACLWWSTVAAATKTPWFEGAPSSPVTASRFSDYARYVFHPEAPQLNPVLELEDLRFFAVPGQPRAPRFVRGRYRVPDETAAIDSGDQPADFYDLNEYAAVRAAIEAQVKQFAEMIGIPVPPSRPKILVDRPIIAAAWFNNFESAFRKMAAGSAATLVISEIAVMSAPGRLKHASRPIPVSVVLRLLRSDGQSIERLERVMDGEMRPAPLDAEDAFALGWLPDADECGKGLLN